MAISELEIRRAALAAAERLRALAGSPKVPVDVDALVAAQGLEKARPADDMEPQESGRLVGIRKLKIYYNRKKDVPRQRFTICHELAHTLFLGEDDSREAGLAVRVSLDRPLPAKFEESLCESVARSLLMPRSEFLNEVSRLRPGLRSIEHLAERFEVGRRAVLMRIETLGIQWPCSVLQWIPVDVHRRVVGFKLTNQWHVSGERMLPFSHQSVVSMEGLHKAYEHLGRLQVDEQSGLRLESRSFMRRGQINVWSLATFASAIGNRSN